MIHVYVSFENGWKNDKNWVKPLLISRVPCVGEKIILDIDETWKNIKVKVIDVCFVCPPKKLLELDNGYLEACLLIDFE